MDRRKFPDALTNRVIVCPTCSKKYLVSASDSVECFDCECKTPLDSSLIVFETDEGIPERIYSKWKCPKCRLDLLVPRFALHLPVMCPCGAEHPLAKFSGTAKRWPLSPLSDAFLGNDQLLRENLLIPLKAAQRYEYDVKKISESTYSVFNPTKHTSYSVELSEIGDDHCECSVFESGAATCIHIEHVRLKLGLPSPAQAIADSQSYAYAWFDKSVLPARVRIGTLGRLEPMVSGVVRKSGIIDSLQRIDEIGVQLKEIGIDLHLMTSVRLAFSQDVAVDTDPELRQTILRSGVAFLKQAIPQLHSFQIDGAIFLASTQRGLLLDEMGLGKTVQAIAAALLLRKFAAVDSVLIVVPKSVFSHWASEIERFTGEVSVTISGSPQQRSAGYHTANLFKLVTLESMRKDFPEIGSPDLVIIDEIHKARSVKSVSSRILRQLNCRFLFGLSGTAIEKGLEDLFGIMRLLRMADLESPAEFQASHIVCNIFGQPEIALHPEFFAVRHAQCMLRRTKQETNIDLPPIELKEIDLELTDLQESMSIPLMDEADALRERLKVRYDLNDFIRQRWLVNRIVELADSTELLDPKTSSSSKLNWLREFLPEKCSRQNEKVVIFTRWTRVQDLICKLCGDLGISWVSLSGNDTAEQRHNAVSKFSRTSGGASVFVSTDAGGVGINLQAARIVINYEPAWNPSTDAQRFQRVHRIGQERQVEAIMLLTFLDRKFVQITHGRKSTSSNRIDEVRQGLHGQQSLTWNELVPVIDYLRDEWT
jgi:superfamily II DNA or RNA helicase